MKALLSILIISSLQVHAKSMPTEDEAKKLFAEYCKGGKQIKSMSESFTAKIQKPESGLPIDEAERILSKRKNAARKLAKEFYITYYDQNCSADTYERDELSKGLEFSKNGKPVNLAWYDFSSLESLSTLQRYYTVRMSPNQQRKLFHHSSVRSEYFRPECSEYDGCIGSVGYFSHDETCKFSASRAIGDSQRFFEVLSQRFSSVTEATGKEANTINFKVQIDLSAFCSSAILKSDLLSK